MTVKVVVLENRLPAIRAGMTSMASSAVRNTVKDIEDISKQSMNGPKHGREYPQSGGKMHRASAPGEPPAIDTGKLVNSINWVMNDSFHGVVYTNTDYAPILEYGSVRMAARPFFTPAATEAWPAFLAAMTKITGVG